MQLGPRPPPRSGLIAMQCKAARRQPIPNVPAAQAAAGAAPLAQAAALAAA